MSGDGKISIPNILEPIEMRDIMSLETIRIIQGEVGRRLKAENIPPEKDVIIEVEQNIVENERNVYVKALFPYVTRDKIIRRVTEGLIQNITEQYYGVQAQSLQYNGSSTDANIERVRNRLPRKLRAYADIS